MSRPYCQFPLCSLAFGTRDDDQLVAIMAYSAVEMGERLWLKYSTDQREYVRAHPPEWCTSSLKNDMHLKAVIGCEKLDLIQPHLRFLVADHAALSQFANEWEQRHGRDAKVRIAVDWVFEAIHGTGISCAELAVLAAIYSKIGASKRPVRITRHEIWRRALGYKSERVFRVETGSYVFGITKRQVRSIIDRLHARKFFARVTVARRETYYSHRLSSTALSQQVFIAKIQRDVARQARIRADADLTKRIQAERGKLAGPNAADTATNPPL